MCCATPWFWIGASPLHNRNDTAGKGSRFRLNLQIPENTPGEMPCRRLDVELPSPLWFQKLVRYAGLDSFGASRSDIGCGVIVFGLVRVLEGPVAQGL